MTVRKRSGRKLIRKLAVISFVTGVVTVGLVAQAGDYLLAFSTPEQSADPVASDGLAYASFGSHPVGVRWFDGDGTVERLTVWYPAVETTGGPSFSYSYGLSLFGPGTITALATYEGRAQPAAVYGTGERPYPLVILSPGYAIGTSSYAWLAEHLATYGLVVVAVEHRESLDPGALWKSTVDRPRQVDALLSLLKDSTRLGEFAKRVDSETVAVIGHSYGGYAAMAAAGGRLSSAAFTATCESESASADPLAFLCDALVPRFGDLADRAGLDDIPTDVWPAWSLDGVDAAVSLAGDAAMFGVDGLAEVTVPTMTIGGTADDDSPFDWGTRYVYENVSSDRKVEIGLEGAGHFVFVGGCDTVRRVVTLVPMGFCSDPAWDRDRAQALVTHYAAAFLLSELRDDPVAELALAPAQQKFSNLSYRAKGY